MKFFTEHSIDAIHGFLELKFRRVFGSALNLIAKDYERVVKQWRFKYNGNKSERAVLLEGAEAYYVV